MLSIITAYKAYLLSYDNQRKIFQNSWVQNLKKVAVESEEVFMKNKIGRQKQSTRKGRYFIYAETEFYASRRSCSGIGHLQIPRLQGDPWA